MYNTGVSVKLAEPTTTITTIPSAPCRKSHRSRPQYLFCPSIFCFTDEIIAQRVSEGADVWMLTEPAEDSNWFMMGETLTCPHCGTVLLAVEPAR